MISLLSFDQRAGCFLAAWLLLTAAPPLAFADKGDCAQPQSTGDGPASSDALAILRAAVGSPSACDTKACICDVNATIGVSSSDALLVLKRAVGQSVVLDCKCGPSFPGLVLVAPIDTTSVQLAWLPASDDHTSPAEIRYDVYISATEFTQPSPATLRGSYPGEAQATLGGLSGDTSYYVLVIAVDDEDNSSTERDVRSFVTPKFPVALDPATPIQKAADLNLGFPTAIGEAELTFAGGPGVGSPSPGSILIGPDGTGGGYLRRVIGSSEVAGQVVVTTFPASLSEAATQFSSTTQLTLFDVGSASTLLSQTSRTRGVHAQSLNGGQTASVSWRDALLSARQLVPSAANLAGDASASAASSTVKVALNLPKISVEVGEQFSAEIDWKFNPVLKNSVEWTIAGGLQEGELTLSGDLDATLRAEFDGLAIGPSLDQPPVPLFEREYASLTFPGGIPVWTVVTLGVDLKITALAQANKRLGGEAKFKGPVNFGLVYNPDTDEWDSPQGIDLTTQFKPVVGIATIEGSAKLTPRVSVKFYETVGGTLSAEFAAGVKAEVDVPDTEPVSPCAPFEPKKLDAELKMSLKGAVDFEIWSVGWKAVLEHTLYEPEPLSLFSLPELEVASSGDGDVFELTATIKDGKNNAFDAASARWDASSGLNDGDLSVTSPDGLRATLACGTIPGPVLLHFSGYGENLEDLLGDAARQCEAIEVQCPGGTTTTTTTSTTTTSLAPGTLQFDSASADLSAQAGFLNSSISCFRDDTESGVVSGSVSSSNQPCVCNDPHESPCDAGSSEAQMTVSQDGQGSGQLTSSAVVDPQASNPGCYGGTGAWQSTGRANAYITFSVLDGPVRLKFHFAASGQSSGNGGWSWSAALDGTSATWSGGQSQNDAPWGRLTVDDVITVGTGDHWLIVSASSDGGGSCPGIPSGSASENVAFSILNDIP